MEDDKTGDGVSIEHIDGQWAVHVAEDGKAAQLLFETEEYAENFAAGQRLRLDRHQTVRAGRMQKLQSCQI